MIKHIYPLDSVLISQTFGSNPGFYSDPKYGGVKGHNGIDFYTGHGTPVYACHDGKAEYQVDPGGGHGVVITSKEDYYYDTIEKIVISKEEAIKRGYKE